MEFYQNVFSQYFIVDGDIDNWNFKGFENNLVWGRRIIENKFMFLGNKKFNNDGLSITYCGHTPVETPIQVMNHRYIDTGAVFAVTKQLDRVMTIVDMLDEIVYTMNMKSKELKSFKWN